MLSILLSGCSAPEKTTSLVTYPQYTGEKINPEPSVKTAAQVRDQEENGRIENALKNGVANNEENIAHYCKISSSIVRAAYANAVPYLYGGTPSLPDYAKELAIDEAQFLSIVRKASEDRGTLVGMNLDIRVYGMIGATYESACNQDPKKYIFNYPKVFHSSSRKVALHEHKKTAPQTVDEIAKSIDEQRRVSAPASN